jgi:hypothetical protein
MLGHFGFFISNFYFFYFFTLMISQLIIIFVNRKLEKLTYYTADNCDMQQKHSVLTFLACAKT